MGLHRPQVVVFNYFRFFPINLLRNIMEECQNVRPYRYFADVHVGQTRQLGNYVGRSLTNHNMFHFEKLALDSDQCYVFAGFLKRNQRQLETRSNSPINSSWSYRPSQLGSEYGDKFGYVFLFKLDV